MGTVVDGVIRGIITIGLLGAIAYIALIAKQPVPEELKIAAAAAIGQYFKTPSLRRR